MLLLRAIKAHGDRKFGAEADPRTPQNKQTHLRYQKFSRVRECFPFAQVKIK